MGIYNTILFKNSKGEHCSIQSKNGDPNLETFEIGCMINVPDGIYFAPEGCFVVFEGCIVAAFDSTDECLYDKWDGSLDYPDLHSIDPVAQMLKQIKDEHTSNSKKD